MRAARLLVLLIPPAIFAAGFSVRYWRDAPPVPRALPFALDLGAARSLAGPVELGPESLHYLRVARTAGGLQFGVMQVSDSEGRSGLIDTAYDVRWHGDTLRQLAGPLQFEVSAFESLQRELRRADWIVITDPSLYHVGGLARSPYLEDVRDRILLRAEQHRSPALREAPFPPSVLEAIPMYACARACAVAPGVVLLVLPVVGDAGRDSAAQLVYLRTRDGSEYLLSGEVGLRLRDMQDSGSNLTPLRSRWWYWRRDRDPAHVAQLVRVLREVRRRAPRLRIVPVHDAVAVEALAAGGVIHRGFARDVRFGGR